MVRRHSFTKSFLVLGVDIVVLNILYHTAFLIRFDTFVSVAHSEFLDNAVSPTMYYMLEAIISIGWVASGVVFRLYGDMPREQFSQETLRVLRTMGGVIGVVFMALVFTRFGVNLYSRWFLFLFFCTGTVGLVVWRGFARLVSENVKDVRNVLVLGAGKTGAQFHQRLSVQPNGSYRIIGFLDNNGVTSKVRPLILGKMNDLDKIAGEYSIDEVVIALPAMSDAELRDLVNECENLCLRVNIIPNEHYYENSSLLEGKMAAVQVGDIPLIRVREDPLDASVSKFIKRSFDIMFALAILLFVFPVVFVFAAVGIKLSSRGPIFFRQERTGENNKSFSCYKFRSMRVMPAKVSDAVQAVAGDNRITAVGKMLRRTSLDELPQFWNVLKGDMSVVGPRPHMLKHTNDYRSVISQYMVRHFVKPGVTGWAQVNGLRGATETPALMQKRVQYDLYYIEHWSFWFDVRIILMTILNMIKGDDRAY